MLLQMAGFPSFLWLINIPWCIHVCIYIHIHTHIYVYTHTPHIFFIHASVDGQLGCSHVLAIVNNAAMNIRVHVYLQDSNFISFGSKVGLLKRISFDLYINGIIPVFSFVSSSFCTAVCLCSLSILLWVQVAHSLSLWLNIPLSKCIE